MAEQEIRFDEFFNSLKKRWVIIVALTLIASIISATLSFFVIKPKYETTTKIFIGKDESEENEYSKSDIVMYQELLKTYSEIIKSKDLIKKAIIDSSLDLEVNEVLKRLSVTSITSTQIIELAYKSENPQEAKIILENITNTSIEKLKELIPNGDARVIETVEYPEKPVSPNKAINIVIVGALGLILGVLIVIFIEILDNTYKNKDQIEMELNLPVLGTIPKNKRHNMFGIKKEPKSIIVESYRTLGKTLQHSAFDENVQVIVVTSSKPGEGKSTTAGNLAMSLTQDGKAVILIDCDLRNPSIHKKFKISNTIGLSEVLIGSNKLAEAAQMYNNNLIILTSGKVPSNPVEILDSKVMTNLIENLKCSFDYIILDSPPVQALTDLQILSTNANGTILVVKSQKTKRDSVKNAIELLKKVNANILGIVLNGMEVRKK